MWDAFQAGTLAHEPFCPEVALESETGDPNVTARNLHSLFYSTPERAILAVIVNGRDTRPVLIVFKTGEVYSASGFAIGEHAEDLARFLTEHNDGDWEEDYDKMLDLLRSTPVDVPGPIDLPRWNHRRVY